MIHKSLCLTTIKKFKSQNNWGAINSVEHFSRKLAKVITLEPITQGRTNNTTLHVACSKAFWRAVRFQTRASLRQEVGLLVGDLRAKWVYRERTPIIGQYSRAVNRPEVVKQLFEIVGLTIFLKENLKRCWRKRYSWKMEFHHKILSH